MIGSFLALCVVKQTFLFRTIKRYAMHSFIKQHGWTCVNQGVGWEVGAVNPCISPKSNIPNILNTHHSHFFIQLHSPCPACRHLHPCLIAPSHTLCDPTLKPTSVQSIHSVMIRTYHHGSTANIKLIETNHTTY